MHNRLLEFARKGQIIKGEITVSDQFLRHISETYPLIPVTGSSIKWSDITDAIVWDLSEISDKELGSIIQSSTIGNCVKVAVIYRGAQPPYIMSLEFLIEHFDTVISIIPHVGFIVGATASDGSIEYHFDQFLEWKLDEGMFLSGRQPFE